MFGHLNKMKERFEKHSMHHKENKIGLENIVQSFTAKVKYLLLIAFQYNICLAKSCSVYFFPCNFFFNTKTI